MRSRASGMAGRETFTCQHRNRILKDASGHELSSVHVKAEYNLRIGVTHSES